MTAAEFDATACGFLLLQFYRQLGLMSVSIASREKMGNNAGGLSLHYSPAERGEAICS